MAALVPELTVIGAAPVLAPLELVPAAARMVPVYPTSEFHPDGRLFREALTLLTSSAAEAEPKVVELAVARARREPAKDGALKALAYPRF